MMEGLREWIFSLIRVSILLSLMETLIPEGTLKKVASFTGGLVLLAALIQPVAGIELAELDVDMAASRVQMEEQKEAWGAAGRESLAAGIAERAETYIWEEARVLGLAVSVKVKTGEKDGLPVPFSAEVTGPQSQALAQYMERQLGIPRERQVWHEDQLEK